HDRDRGAMQMLPDPTHAPSGDTNAPRRHDIGGEAIDRRLMNAERLGSAEGLARELDDHAAISRHGHLDCAFGLPARHRGDLAAEISVGPINALAPLAERETRNLDGAADLAFGILLP